MHDPSAIFSSIVPLPFILTSGVYDGWDQTAPSCCKTCEHFACLNSKLPKEKHQICQEGMSFVPFSLLGVRGCIGGFIHTTKNNIVGGERRKALKRLWLEETSLQKIIANTNRYEATFEREMKDAASETTSFLHDIRTGLSLVMSSCERLISGVKGVTFSDKLKKADPGLFRLYQAVSLLTQQLGLVDIISNPDSIIYGAKPKSDIYQFFYKMVKLFEPRAWDRRMDIRLEGNIYVSVEFYNSFQLVPLVLLDNAIKYGESGNTIYLNFIEKNDGLYVEFCSWGVPIPQEYAEAVFLKRVRGPNVYEKSNEGSGLGLHIASLVTKAHGFELSYESRNSDGKFAWNCFTLFIDSRYLI